MRNNLFLGVAALALGLAGNASAGVVVTSTQTKLDTRKADPMTVYVEADRLKVVTPDNIVIFRGDLNRMWVIDPQRQSYMEMTPETMQRMGGQMAGAASQLGAAQAQLQAQMAQMPPEQRAMMEQMLAQRGLGGAAAGRGGPPAPPQISFAKAGGSKRVAAWNCDLYKKTVNGQQEEDICIAPAASTGLEASDFAVMDKLSAFVAPVMSSPMMPRTDYMNWNDMNKAIGFQGMPLDTTTYVQGRPATQQVVTKIERTGIAANIFDLPQGLTKREIGAPPPR
jgi:hypothetical protein